LGFNFVEKIIRENVLMKNSGQSKVFEKKEINFFQDSLKRILNLCRIEKFLQLS